MKTAPDDLLDKLDVLDAGLAWTHDPLTLPDGRVIECALVGERAGALWKMPASRLRALLVLAALREWSLELVEDGDGQAWLVLLDPEPRRLIPLWSYGALRYDRRRPRWT